MDISLLRIVYEFAPGIGGSITHIIELSEKIDNLLSDQVVIAPDHPNAARSDSEFGFEVIRVPIKAYGILRRVPSGALVQLSYSMSVVTQIHRIYSSGRSFDILHVHGPLLGSYIRFFLKMKSIKIPIIEMSHGGYGENGQPNTIASGRFNKLLTRALIRLFPADSYLALDDGTGVEILQKTVHNINKEYTIVYHGIDTDIFSPISENISPESDGLFRILFPHRIIPFKRPDIALEVLKILINRYNIVNIEIVFLANDEERMQIQELVRMNDLCDHVRFESRKKPLEMTRMYTTCDVVIGTSIISNLNRAIQEAMACEKAIIIFDSGDLNGFITNANGILVKNGDINGFVEALWKLYQEPDLRVSIGKEARTTILKERSWKKRIDAELKVYESILTK